MPSNIDAQTIKDLNDRVRYYWEQEPCGTSPDIVGTLQPYSAEWFQQIEHYRYQVEPFIHSTAQFTRHRRQKILEVGVGAGTDHLQWARAGADCYGIDLTRAALKTTQAHLANYDLSSKLSHVNGEILPFANESFDLVYSWGVIHHSEKPELILAEIKRVLKPGGRFVGMMYGRYSLAVFKRWIKHALLKGQIRRTLADVVWNHVESVGTKAYTVNELRDLFADFQGFSATPLITKSDVGDWPDHLVQFVPAQLGWFIAIQAHKPR